MLFWTESPCTQKVEHRFQVWEKCFTFRSLSYSQLSVVHDIHPGSTANCLTNTHYMLKIRYYCYMSIQVAELTQ